MWEFFTLGGNPYPGIEIDEEFYKKLKAGYRMGKPEFCPDEIYQIMQNCWSACPDSRPDFDDISVAIGDLLEAGVKQHYLDVNTPYIEMNRKMLNHDYFNLQTAQNQGQCHIYINSEICNHALNDNTIALSKEFSSKATSKDKTELNFSTFLDTITEDEVMRTKTIEEQRNKAR
ncbi:Platelet-derived growth factor receptor alpha, partial [Stegodyphus mimosarum]